MPLLKADRIAFSLAEVQATQQIVGINSAKDQIQKQIVAAQALDDANARLFAPGNSLINEYQLELQYVDGNVRTTIVEQDIQDAAARKLQNHFFPNDPTIPVPFLSGTHNVWTQFAPLGMTFAQGLNYQQVYPSTVPFEGSTISAITALITSAGAFFDIENTSGQHCVASGTCSLPLFTDQPTCVLNGGIWTPGPDVISSFPAVVTLKNNLVAAVSQLVSITNTELAAIPTNDPNPTRQAFNNAAIAYISGTFLPALNLWLAYSDFNPPVGVSTCAAFYAFNSNLLAPTKLHSTQLAALQTALNSRLSFLTTRLGQVSTFLGTITQNPDGSIASSSGLYGQRFSFLSLRLNILTGSLSKLLGLLSTSSAQTAIAASIAENRATYYSICPTSIFQAPGNGTPTISLVDVSFIAPGDLVYISADNQEELIRAIKSINGNSVILDDQVPPQYSPATNGRLYKDLT